MVDWLDKSAHYHGTVIDVSSAAAKRFIGFERKRGRGDLTCVVEVIHFPPAMAIFRMRLTHAALAPDSSIVRANGKLRGLDALLNARQDGPGIVLVDVPHQNILMALGAIEPPVSPGVLSGKQMFLISPVSGAVGPLDGCKVSVLGSFSAGDENNSIAYYVAPHVREVAVRMRANASLWRSWALAEWLSSEPPEFLPLDPAEGVMSASTARSDGGDSSGPAPAGLVAGRQGLMGVTAASGSMAANASQSIFMRIGGDPSNSRGASGGSSGDPVGSADAARMGGEMAAPVPGLNHEGPAPFRPRAPPISAAGAAAAAAARDAARIPGGAPQLGVLAGACDGSVPLVVTMLSLTPAAQARDVVWLDQLCSLLATVVPPDAHIPADDPMARYSFIQETLDEMLQKLPNENIVAAADVLSACRSLKVRLRSAERVIAGQQQRDASDHEVAYRAAQLEAERSRAALQPPPAPGASGGLPPVSGQCSFGRLASLSALHQMTQAAGSAVAPAERDDFQAVQRASITAATAIDQEDQRGTGPLMVAARRIDALQDAITGPSPGPAVRALGAGINAMPAELQRIDMAESQSYHAASKNLVTAIAWMAGANERFLTGCVPLAVAILQVDHEPSMPERRRLNIRAIMSALLKGDLLSNSLSEMNVIRKGGASMFHSMDSLTPDVSISFELLDGLDRLARICTVVPQDHFTLFGELKRLLKDLINVSGVLPAKAAEWAREQLLLFPSKEFRRGTELMKPQLTAAFWSRPVAVAAYLTIAQEGKMAVAANAAIQAAVSSCPACGGHPGLPQLPPLPPPPPQPAFQQQQQQRLPGVIYQQPQPQQQQQLQPLQGQQPAAQGSKSSKRRARQAAAGAKLPHMGCAGGCCVHDAQLPVQQVACQPAFQAGPAPFQPGPLLGPQFALQPGPLAQQPALRPAAPGVQPALAQGQFNWQPPDGRPPVDTRTNIVAINPVQPASPIYSRVDAATLYAWTRDNKAPNTKGRCFNFHMRGFCIRPVASPCAFEHS